jgi:gliding motility-associated-like protein
MQKYIFVSIMFLGLACAAHAQTFVRQLGLSNRDERATVIHRDPQGNLFLAGSVNDSALVQRVDEFGNILWSIKFRPAGSFPKHVFHLESAPDGSLIGCGNGLSPGDAPFEGFHFRMDVNGNVIWIRNWSDEMAYNRRISAINSQEYLLFSDYYPTSGSFGDLFQARVDAASGDITWVSDRHDLYSVVPYIDDIIGVCKTPDAYYGVGRLFAGGSPLSKCRVFVNKYSSTGEHMWTKYLLFSNSANRRMYGTDIVYSNDSLALTYFGDVAGSSGNFTIGLIRADTLGNVAWAKNYDVMGSGQEIASRILSTSFGYLVMGRTNTSGQQRIFLLALSFTGEVLWAKRYGNSGDVHDTPHFYTTNLSHLDDGFLFSATRLSGNDEDILLFRSDASGNIECDQTENVTVETTNLPTLSFNTDVSNIPFSITLAQDPPIAGSILFSSDCPLMVDLGSDTSSCTPVTFSLAVPNATYSWQDGSASADHVADSSGIYWVDVTVDCCTVRDSISVNISSLFDTVELGSDTLLCPGAELLLSTGVYGEEHVWQDGSGTDSYLVDAPGVYWVSVGVTPCSVIDSIVVDYLDDADFELGSDTVLCEGESILLEVPADATGGVWQDGSVSPEVVVTETGTYSLAAELQGCLMVDSISVQFDPVPLLQLGTDTVLCEGEEIVLNGSPDFPNLWQDGSSSSSLLVSSSGTYWVEVGEPGCTVIDTVSIAFLPYPLLDLGPDTVLCDTHQLQLEVDSGYDLYVWQDGSSASGFVVTGAGTYSVLVTDQGCASSDSILVGTIAPPVVDLGPDIAVCAGTVPELVTGLTGQPHVWQDGSIAESFSIGSSGMYWVVVGPSGCGGSDTINVEVIPLPIVELGQDTVLCESQVHVLSSGYPAANSTWQDGGLASTFTVTGPGEFHVVVDIQGCTDSDTISIAMDSLPSLTLPSDTVLCGASTFLLTASATFGDTIVWQDGSAGSTYLVPGAGVFIASVTNSCGRVTDSIHVSVAPPVLLPERYLVCFGDLARMDWSHHLDAISWSNGLSGTDLELPEGQYSYVAVDTNGCLREGDLLIYSDPVADGTSFIPNTFTPNGDGVNDLFAVPGVYRSGFSLEIYNRWGELLYETQDPVQGWNGYCKGSAAPDGTYIYHVKFKADCKGQHLVSTVGHVTLLR